MKIVEQTKKSLPSAQLVAVVLDVLADDLLEFWERFLRLFDDLHDFFHQEFLQFVEFLSEVVVVVDEHGGVDDLALNLKHSFPDFDNVWCQHLNNVLNLQLELFQESLDTNTFHCNGLLQRLVKNFSFGEVSAQFRGQHGLHLLESLGNFGDCHLGKGFQ